MPPGRGSCPLTGPLPFDLIYTDYHGLQQMKQHMGLSLKKHKLVGTRTQPELYSSLMRLLPAKIQLPKLLDVFTGEFLAMGHVKSPPGTGRAPVRSALRWALMDLLLSSSVASVGRKRVQIKENDSSVWRERH